jgi:excisionase family DNA binding protein
MKASNIPEPRFLTVPEVGVICGVSRNTVYNWVKKGVLDAYQTPGRTNLIRPGDLILFMERNGMFIPNQLVEIANVDSQRVGFIPKSSLGDAGKLPIILCMDDDPKERSVCERALKGKAEVLQASTGYEGLHLLTVREDITIALIDMDMPGLSGEQIFVEAKGLRPAVKLVAMSRVEPEFSDAVHVNGFLKKPLKLKTVSDGLTPLLNR